MSLGENHDLQEVIHEVEKFRRVARQRRAGKYHDRDTCQSSLPLPDNYYPGLHRPPLAGLSESLCYFFSQGHMERCWVSGRDPEDRRGSESESSSDSFWGDDGGLAGDAMAMMQELDDRSDCSSGLAVLDVDVVELDG